MPNSVKDNNSAQKINFNIQTGSSANKPIAKMNGFNQEAFKNFKVNFIESESEDEETKEMRKQLKEENPFSVNNQ